MRHLKKTAKLGRTGTHRNAMLANMVCSLIIHKRIQTTLAKAKAARPVAEKMVTLGKSGTIHDRRLAVARLHQEDAVRILFNEIAPTQKERRGGYTRIVKLHARRGDASNLAILEWVDAASFGATPESTDTAAATEAGSESATKPPAEGAKPSESK